MAKWVCPNCGKNERIAERSVCVVEWMGKLQDESTEDFTDFTHVADTNLGNPEILDSIDGYDIQYCCYSCNMLFNYPDEIEDEQT